MWQKLDKIMNGIGTVLSVASVAVVVILGILQVLFRFVIKISVPWTEEVMRALFIYIVFFGVILVERDNSEIRTTMLIEKFPGITHDIWECVVSVLSIIFNVLLLIGTAKGITTTTSTLSSLPMISMKVFFIPMIISLPLMIIYQIYYLVKNIQKVSKKDTGKENA